MTDGKYEEVYLKAYERVPEVRTSTGRCLNFYDAKRRHSRHGGKTPNLIWFAKLLAMGMAA